MSVMGLLRTTIVAFIGMALLNTVNAQPNDVSTPEHIESLDISFDESDAAAAATLEGVEMFFDGAVGTLLQVYEIPGITVSVVYGGKLAFSKGYGFTDVARTNAVDPNETLFRIGSISKPFTWTAVMQLVEQGKLDLDVDINTYLSAFKIPEAFGEPITLRHILAHSAGFEDGGLGYLFRASQVDQTGLEQWLMTYMPTRVRKPGTFSSYSNYGTALAGYIVGEVSGLEFDSYIERNIFEPLGMVHSTFREPVPEALAVDQSDNFLRELGDYVNADFEYIHDAGPAGSMSSTADDMAKFMLAHLNDGALNGVRILKLETARQMRSRLFPHRDAIPSMLYGFYEKTYNGRFTYGHGGDTIYFHSEMTLVPSEGVGVFVSSNAPEGAVAVRQLVPAFFDEFFPPRKNDIHPSPDNPETADKSLQQALAKYAGAYRFNRRSYMKWEKILALSGDAVVGISPRGGLILPKSAGKSERFVPLNEDGVFRSVDDADKIIAFRENEKDEVTHLFLGPIAAFEKVGPLEAARTHQLILGLCAIVFAGVMAGSLWGIPKWLSMSRDEKLARAAVFGGSAFNLAFVALFGFGMANNMDELIYTGLPNVQFILSLPLLALLCTAISALFLARVWHRGFWSLFGRIRYTVVTALLALFAVVLNYWNLLGPWYA